ncbi:3-methyl-2-oxobutanoate hydroxymethyltransferase [bacterium]
MNKISPQILKKMKTDKEKITALTSYNITTAKLCNDAGIDIILVGDSVGNVVLGYANTIPVTMSDMIFFTKIAKRTNPNSMLVSDMPFMSYQPSNEIAVRNAGRLIKIAGAEGVKIEGGSEMLERITKIIEAGIPVMGHLGLQPQSVYKTSGYKVQGRVASEADKIIADAKKLEQSGAFSIVLECIPEELAKEITENISIPTIGIGAGRYTDGQILVTEDIIGLTQGSKKFLKKYANIYEEIQTAIKSYKNDVKSGKFPEEKNCF